VLTHLALISAAVYISRALVKPGGQPWM